MSAIIMKAMCPGCIGERNCSILFQTRVDGCFEQETGFSGWDKYYVLKCMGCDETFFLHENWFSEDMDCDGSNSIKRMYYPKIENRRANKNLRNLFGYTDALVVSLYKEIYMAINNDLPQLAAAGTRALIERISDDLIGCCNDFKEYLTGLLNSGHISEIQCDVLSKTLEIGHGVMHRGHVPHMPEVEQTLDIVENLIEQVYINQSKADNIKKKTPPRTSRNQNVPRAGNIISGL